MRPTSDRIRSMFTLRPDGCLVWIDPSKYHIDLVGKNAGAPIPGGSGKTYWAVQIDGVKVRRSHIVFCLTHGRWPSLQIDHINGNSLDDRPCNLREATVTQNAWNHRTRKKSSPWPMGVRRSKSGRFVARIAVNHNKITIGTFDTASDAEAAYRSARRQHFGEFA